MLFIHICRTDANIMPMHFPLISQKTTSLSVSGGRRTTDLYSLHCAPIAVSRADLGGVLTTYLNGATFNTATFGTVLAMAGESGNG